jgi:hypothetical protein
MSNVRSIDGWTTSATRRSIVCTSHLHGLGQQKGPYGALYFEVAQELLSESADEKAFPRERVLSSPTDLQPQDAISAGDGIHKALLPRDSNETQ